MFRYAQHDVRGKIPDRNKPKTNRHPERSDGSFCWKHQMFPIEFIQKIRVSGRISLLSVWKDKNMLFA